MIDKCLCFLLNNCLVYARKLQDRGWKPRWFQKDEDGCYHYMGGYWEAREKQNWDEIPDIFRQHCDFPVCAAEE
ncbi:UNVERIFIED_CONTAM: Oxysterol-binding protein-related protein 1D [Sesamum angustifolium]|uniref:Oxysterol-binding protein-related protein 1D n=1 Tax=Sesamum angustifolium TaxID=2727405 RepID=A0AAW2M7A0_9LAMI